MDVRNTIVENVDNDMRLDSVQHGVISVTTISNETIGSLF